ncbi:MAG: MATE family efflux transporter [Kiritimatiellae bacterium]|nr:MATE family efflux transporter [Kiritimatiellia bacterium]
MKRYLEILRLVWPLALGMLNNAVLQFVDGVFLARESLESLEASLPASMLAILVMGFFQSVVAYSGTFVAQYHGAGDSHGVRMSYRAGLVITLAAGVLAVAIIPIGLMVAPFMSENPAVVARASSYYAIVSVGAIALCGQMAASSYFTGRGKTRLVFWVNVLGNAVNIALDPILIFGLFGCPRLGMAGAAYATVVAMFVQWGLLAWCAERDLSRLRGGGAADVPRLWPLVGKVLRYGVPSGAYSVLNILSFTIFVFVTGRIGDQEFAVSNACFKVNYFLFAPMEGFSICAATLVGQAQGRGDSAAAHRDAMRTLFLGLLLVAVLSALAVVFYRPILSLFASPGVQLSTFYALGFWLFLLMAAWQVFDATDVIVSGALKGAGDTKFVMWWMSICAFGLWMPLVWAVAKWHNTMTALWGTMVVYVVVICAGTLVRWYNGGWKRIKLV